MSYGERLTVERIERAFERTGYRPVYGLFFAGSEDGGRQKYACPACAVVKAEYGRLLGPRSVAGANSVAFASQLLGLSQDYLRSFMYAYDGQTIEDFHNVDELGLKDGEAAREAFPPEWGRG